jgi:signal peptidase II
MTERKRQILFILCTLGVVFVVDQVTKMLVMANLEAGGVPWRYETFFWITHERNEGLVGGAFRDIPGLAFALALLATGVLIYLFRHLIMESKVQAIAYGMVAGGAAGNLVDRILHGSVTDFLQVHFYFIPFDFPWKQYPAFNVADSCICIGVVILIVTWHRAEKALESNAAHTV